MKFPNLKEYALTYLGRYSNSEQGLIRVLKAKINRWAIKAENEGMDRSEIEDLANRGQSQIAEIVANIKKLGFIDDHSFAESKISSLIRSGRSQKVIQNKLLQKGVASDVIHSILNQYEKDETELCAALIYARKKRIGPFRRTDREFNAEIKQKEQMAFARGGFPFSMASQVLAMEIEEAEETIQKLRFA